MNHGNDLQVMAPITKESTAGSMSCPRLALTYPPQLTHLARRHENSQPGSNSSLHSCEYLQAKLSGTSRRKPISSRANVFDEDLTEVPNLVTGEGQLINNVLFLQGLGCVVVHASWRSREPAGYHVRLLFRRQQVLRVLCFSLAVFQVTSATTEN